VHHDLPANVSKFPSVTFSFPNSVCYDLRSILFRALPSPPESLPNQKCPLCMGEIIYERKNIGRVGECSHCHERITFC
jgi:hypothetical protein